MKKLFTLLGLITSSILFAQLVPQGFNYQATVRNNLGDIMPNKEVKFRFKIIKDIDNSVSYSELQTTTTDAIGGVKLIIGKGTVEYGSLAGVKWGAESTYSFGIEMNVGDGLSYVDMGKQTLVSVPYALYAQNAFFHKVGDLYQGGIIVSVWKDDAFQEHGLIASLKDLGTAVVLSTGKDMCNDYTYGGYDDWYLPSFEELKLAYSQAFMINRVLGNDGFPYDDQVHWSSTITPNNPLYAVGVGLNTAGSRTIDGTGGYNGSAGTPFKIRAFRTF